MGKDKGAVRQANCSLLACPALNLRDRNASGGLDDAYQPPRLRARPTKKQEHADNQNRGQYANGDAGSRLLDVCKPVSHGCQRLDEIG